MTSRRFLARAVSLLLPLAPLAFLSGGAQAQPAKPAAAPAKEIPPFEVAADPARGIWYGRFGRTNCSWVDMGDGVLVIDAGASEADGKNLAAQIKETTKGKPIRWFVLTHLHADSNTGLTSFLPTSATIVVNDRVAAQVAGPLAGKEGKPVSVLGVSDRLTIATGKRVAEVVATSGPAHTDHDLFVVLPAVGAAFVGDLVTPGRCPMMSDPACSPEGWLKALTRIEGYHPTLLVATRGDSTTLVERELNATRNYVNRVLTVLADCKKQGFADARVTSQLVLSKMGEYCPNELDAVNGLALYHRMKADGTIPAGADKPPAPKGAAAPKKK